MKYFVVSDVHDHYYLLKEVLDKNGFDINNSDHKLIICGDAFVRGNEPGELFKFLKLLYSKDKLIYIYGNHDLELLNNINKGEYSKSNLICINKIKEYGIDINEVSKFISEVAIPYFETKDYIFIHGFLPTKSNTYNPNWRNSSEKEFKGTTIKDGMKLSMFYKISEPNKTIVFGHFSTSRCYKMKSASLDDWNNKIYKDTKDVPLEGYKTFYGDTFIALDSSCYKTGFLNLLIINN